MIWCGFSHVPAREIHCLDLADRPADGHGHDAVLDDRARREIHARVRDLQSEIDDAAAAHDLGRRSRRARSWIGSWTCSRERSGCMAVRGDSEVPPNARARP